MMNLTNGTRTFCNLDADEAKAMAAEWNANLGDKAWRVVPA